MIAEMGIAPLALLDISAQTQRLTARSMWNSWLEVVRAHGSLVFASDDDFDLMKELLAGADLTPDEKKRWTEMLVFLKDNHRFRIAKPGLRRHLDEIGSPSEISAVRDRLPLVAVLAREAFERLYPDSEDGVSAIDDNTSASITGTVETAPVMQNVSAIARKERYPAGAERDAIWRELFQDLTAKTKRVTIVDRYAFAELLRRQERRTHHTQAEHLGWLFRRIDRYAPPGSRVQLYTQLAYTPEGQQTVLDLERLLRDAWIPASTGSLRAVDIVAVRWEIDKHPHNRHIRFGDSWGFKLEEGLDRLSRPAVRDPDGFNYSFMWRKEHLDRFKARERLVQNDASAQRTTWTIRSHD
ncbi:MULTISPECIES: hypothetical protein [Microbacterium]|uniref:hypothetical protein n=1 Tax=Microbacterium TaxID=33882 RepID=UPI00344D2BC1